MTSLFTFLFLSHIIILRNSKEEDNGNKTCGKHPQFPERTCSDTGAAFGSFGGYGRRGI